MRTKAVDIDQLQRASRAEFVRAQRDAATSLDVARDAATLAIAQLERDHASGAVIDSARLARAAIVHAIDSLAVRT